MPVTVLFKTTGKIELVIQFVCFRNHQIICWFFCSSTDVTPRMYSYCHLIQRIFLHFLVGSNGDHSTNLFDNVLDDWRWFCVKDLFFCHGQPPLSTWFSNVLTLWNSWNKQLWSKTVSSTTGKNLDIKNCYWQYLQLVKMTDGVNQKIKEKD